MARLVSDGRQSKLLKTVEGNEIRAIDQTMIYSNLAAPTIKNPSYSSKKGIFSTLINCVAPDSGNKIPRKVLKNKKGYPYRKGRLIHYDYDVTKPWYITFYAWDIGLKKLVRKRVGKEELNSIHDVRKRKAKSVELLQDLNEQLANGGHLETYPEQHEVSAFNFHGYKLLDAFTYVENHKRTIENKSRSTSKEYLYTKTTLEDFLTHEKLDPKITLRQITPTFLQRYCIYLREERKVSNKTYNGRIGSLHSCFETLRKLDLKLWPDRNPAARLEKLSVTTKTHSAYTIDQLKKFVEIVKERDPQLLLFIRFIYYTLARPKELRYLKVGHIRADFNKILMVGEHAKTDQEKYVGISKEFMNIINESGILTYPPHLYVFTDKGTPGEKPVGMSYFYKRFRIYLAALGFRKLNAGYTLYSFKHTGAVQLYLATKDPHLVQQQLRHTSLDQTTTYLKDLGLFVDFTALENWKGF